MGGAGGYDISLSNSEATSNRGGGGDININSGGSKSNLSAWMILGAALVVVLGLFVLKRHR